VENPKNPDRVTVDSVVDDVRLDVEAPATGEVLGTWLADLRRIKQALKGRLKARRIGVLLGFSPRGEGEAQNAAQIVFGLFGDVEATV
jgi:hypothetical protein